MSCATTCDRSDREEQSMLVELFLPLPENGVHACGERRRQLVAGERDVSEGDDATLVPLGSVCRERRVPAFAPELICRSMWT